jgi:hypothetical protein
VLVWGFIGVLLISIFMFGLLYENEIIKMPIQTIQTNRKTKTKILTVRDRNLFEQHQSISKNCRENLDNINIKNSIKKSCQKYRQNPPHKNLADRNFYK